MSVSSFQEGLRYGDPEGQAGRDRRFQVSGRDPDAAAAAYRDVYGGDFRFRPHDRDFSFRYALVGDERLTLRTSSSSGSVSGDVPHLRDYVVSWFRFGTGLLSLHRFTRHGSTTAPFLFPSEERFGLEFAPHRQNLIHFAPGFLEDVATEFHAGPRQRVSFDHEADPDPSVLDRWRTAVSSATSALLEAAAAPLLRFSAELSLARILLALFPWRAWDVPAGLREPASSRTRIALDFLQHHAGEPITPADAAQAAGLHTRSFQQSTQRHLGISPSTYLRNVRLDRARAELLENEPRSASVALIARGWGFGNLGRFAATYSERFGEKPNQTLRR